MLGEEVDVVSGGVPRALAVVPGESCATLKHMTDVGIRALKQNASAVVSRAALGEVVTITDRGRPVARLTAIPASALQEMLDDGRARPPRRSLGELLAPTPGPPISAQLRELRDAERF
jgi:prevent-host-death family protein